MVNLDEAMTSNIIVDVAVCNSSIPCGIPQVQSQVESPKQDNLSKQDTANKIDTVSYTHLTLPTKRIV